MSRPWAVAIATASVPANFPHDGSNLAGQAGRVGPGLSPAQSEMVSMAQTLLGPRGPPPGMCPGLLLSCEVSRDSVPVNQVVASAENQSQSSPRSLDEKQPKWILDPNANSETKTSTREWVASYSTSQSKRLKYFFKRKERKKMGEQICGFRFVKDSPIRHKSMGRVREIQTNRIHQC